MAAAESGIDLMVLVYIKVVENWYTWVMGIHKIWCFQIAVEAIAPLLLISLLPLLPESPGYEKVLVLSVPCR